MNHHPSIDGLRASPAMGMTMGERLDLLMIQRVHVTEISDPMLRSLWWKRWEWENINVLVECRSMPSEYSHLMASAEDEIATAREARRKILTHRWAMRVWAGERVAA